MRKFSKQQIREVPKENTLQRTLTAYKTLTSCNKPEDRLLGIYKYNEDDLLGKGFGGRVYKGVQALRPHNRYAIKVVDLQKFRGANLEMLETEIEIHKSLQHQNIVKLHEVIKTAQYYYLVMQYCPHGNLTEYIAQKKKLSESNALQIMSQIISAYKYLLQQGVVHRDIKPANIMRVGNKWKVSDFGFSAKSRLGFKDNMKVGTPLYMAPQSLKKSYYSYKSDFYSIGIVFYQMLVGQTPRQVNSHKELMERVSEQIKMPKFIKNGKIVEFLTKICLVSEGKRMNKEEFIQFDFENSNVSSRCTQSNSYSTISYKDLRYFNDESTLKSRELCVKENSKDEYKKSFKILRRQTASSSKSRYSNSEQNKKSTAKNVMFSNKQKLQHQLQIIQHFYFSIQNIQSFHLDSNTESMFVLSLFKLLLKLLRLLCDKSQNYLQLCNWQEFIQCKLYLQLYTEFNIYSQRYQKQYLEFIRHNDIKVIRAVNRKFPELCNTAPLTQKFYQNFKDFVVGVIKEHESQVTTLVQKGEDHLNDRFEALQSLYKIYRLAQARSNTSWNQKGSQKVIVLEDYTKSKLTKHHFCSLKRVIKQI